MNNQERPIAQHKFYYDDSSDYDTDIEEDEEYNSRPDVKDIKQKPVVTRKKIQNSLLDLFDSDTD